MPVPKIIVTIAEQNVKYISQFYEAGMDIARFNLKYEVKREHVNLCRVTEFDTPKGFGPDDVSKISYLGEPDYLAISFCENVDDIEKAREKVHSRIIAKIESREGIQKIYELSKAADGIMIARGDLLKNFRLELPRIEDGIQAIAALLGKEVWVATGLLPSGTSKDITASELYYIACRAKCADAFLLSDEVIFEKNPVRVVRNLRNILEMYA